jgi:DNA-binding SARP family transcriptional activator
MRVLVDLYERESLLRRALHDGLTETERAELHAAKDVLMTRGWEHLTWEWFAPYDARYAALLVAVFTFFIEDALAKGRQSEALATATEFLALDPSDERAHELLKRARQAASASNPIRPL